MREAVRHDQLIRRQRGLVSLNLKFSRHIGVSRPGEGFAAGRDFASTESRQRHCLTAERAMCGCYVPGQLRNRDKFETVR